MGVELKLFIYKDNTIQIGVNILINNVDWRIRYTSVTAIVTCNLTCFTRYDIFKEINPETGITALELWKCEVLHISKKDGYNFKKYTLPKIWNWS